MIKILKYDENSNKIIENNKKNTILIKWDKIDKL